MSPDKNTFLYLTVASSEYLYPIDEVQEVSEMLIIKPYPVQVPGHIGIVNLRGQVIPVISFKNSIPELKNFPHQRLVIGHLGNSLFGFICNSVKKVVLDELQAEKLLSMKVTHINERPIDLLNASDFVRKEAA